MDSIQFVVLLFNHGSGSIKNLVKIRNLCRIDKRYQSPTNLGQARSVASMVRLKTNHLLTR